MILIEPLSLPNATSFCLQAALKDGAKSVAFLGQTISVDRNAGIFVTLNPAGKGYGGRSKLPDNLKALFRSVAMTVPDNELIAEVSSVVLDVEGEISLSPILSL